MGSEITPSLISKGGGPLRTPHGSHRIRYPMGDRVKNDIEKTEAHYGPAKSGCPIHMLWDSPISWAQYLYSSADLFRR